MHKKNLNIHLKFMSADLDNLRRDMQTKEGSLSLSAFDLMKP